VPFDIPEWMLLEQVNECEQLSTFPSSEKWEKFSMCIEFFEFVAKYPMRNIDIHKD